MQAECFLSEITVAMLVIQNILNTDFRLT